MQPGSKQSAGLDARRQRAGKKQGVLATAGGSDALSASVRIRQPRG